MREGHIHIDERIRKDDLYKVLEERQLRERYILVWREIGKQRGRDGERKREREREREKGRERETYRQREREAEKERERERNREREK